jgi:hypothetical protein
MERFNVEGVEITRPGPNVTRIKVHCGSKDASTLPVMLTADRHWDNPKSDHALQLKHLEWAKERDALIVDVGDLFCAMQGKGDRRASKGDIRPEHDTPNYLGALSKTAAEFFEPYAKHIAVFFHGNHETSVIKHKEYDLTERLSHDINRAGGQSQKMGYSGFVQVQFIRGRASFSWTMYCAHGSGGGGPVTKGVIGTNRRAVFQPDADIVATGHIHESWVMEITRERVLQSGQTYIDTQTHIQIPTYKEEYLSHKGWHVERGAPPKPMGAWAIEFGCHRYRKRESEYQIMRLK